MKRRKLFGLAISLISVFALAGCNGEPIVGPQGPQGETGERGEDGVSIVSVDLTSSDGLADIYTITYSDGTTSNFVVTNGKDGEQGIQGIPGEDGHTPVITISSDGYWIIDGVKSNTKAQGEQGEPGKDGTSLLTGNGEPAANLGKDGDSYINLDTWDFYVKTSETWNYVGNIKGEQGNDGQAGGDGEDGLSAYEIYIKYHPEYTGTEEEWINDLINGNLFDNNSSIILEETGEPIFINDIFQINYETNNINGQLTWESSNNEIAKVDDNGCVTALGIGEVTITASYLKYSDSITFTIFERNQVVSEGFSFLENDKGYSIVGYEGSDVIVNVPSEYNGLPVTEILNMKSPYILELYIPSSVTTIREGAFADCNKLEKIFIPQSVSTIEGSIFSVNHSVNVYCETFTKPNDWADNWYASGSDFQAKVRIVWGSFLGQNFNYDGVNYAVCRDINGNKYIEAVSQLNPFDYNISLLDSYIIGGEKIQVKSIAQYAFAWCGLKTVHLPNSITNIGTQAFFGCWGLYSINIPESVVVIGASAFSYVRGNIYCKTSSPLSGWDKLFNYCGGKLIFDSYIEQEFKDGYYTYAVSKKENGSKYITILEYDGLEENIVVPDYFTFNGENIYVEAISGFAFEYCKNIISIHLPDTIKYLGEGAFYECTNLSTINIPNQITIIDNWCFYDSRLLTSITIPDSVTTIGDNAFSRCSSLTSINIPNSVTTIGDNAFLYCSNLETVNIGENSQLTEIGASAFSHCFSLTSISIPNSVTTIGDCAFHNCSSLTSINIPNSVTTIRGNPFQGCDNLTIYCEASAIPSGWDSGWNESNCPVVWNSYKVNNEDLNGIVMHDSEGNPYIVITGYSGSETNVVIPEYITVNGEDIIVKEIPKMAFYDNDNIVSVTIPNSVTTIGEYAFFNCSNLEIVNIGENSQLTEIGDRAFYNCSSLTSIYIPDSVTMIGYYAFDSCDNLTIYCEASAKPNGWPGEWTNWNCPVEWNITYEEYLAQIASNN